MNNEGEINFLRAYKDFIYHFNMLDRNIGYCLYHCLKRKGNKAPEKWTVASFDSKIKKIMALARSSGLQDLFKTWHQQIRGIQHFRNIVTHGNWEWNELLPKPIDYHAPEIEDGKGTLTTDEFRDKLNELINISKSFNELRHSLEKTIEETPNQAQVATP